RLGYWPGWLQSVLPGPRPRDWRGPLWVMSVTAGSTGMLGGIAAAIGFLEGVAARAATGPTVDASIAHIGGIRGNLMDIIDPQSRTGRSGDRHRRATFW